MNKQVYTFPNMMVPHPAFERPGAEAINVAVWSGKIPDPEPLPFDTAATICPGSTRPVLPARYWFSSAKLWLARDAVVLPVAS